MRAAIVVLGVCAASATAHAFCGFYVAGSDQQLTNDATQVVLMRVGTRTVLSMQNDYEGPVEAFALVVPVPVVLHEGDVKTLPKDVFARVEQMSAPRLVEYWEQDPCAPAEPAMDQAAYELSIGVEAAPRPDAELGVKIEAKFAVGEYQIVILSATDSTSLETWLRANKYNIPAGAEPLLRPYVEAGSKFFVAKVDPAKVAFDHGRAVLSPLRFHYDSEDFALPIRLGLANSAGTQDLIVDILAPAQRYEVANYDNVTIPTNLDVVDSVKDRFSAFYAALFDDTLAKHPHAVVTEYAWQATTCDPCPGPTLQPADFVLLGADVVDPVHGSDFVLTRLHARYGKELSDDLKFRTAKPIIGGRERFASDGELEEGAHPAAVNTFQARYAIRHPWIGPIRCEQPRRGIWGDPPRELARSTPAVRPALDLASAPRGQLQLASAIVHASTPPPAPQVAVGAAPRKSGCGCTASDPAGLALALLLLVRPKRSRARSTRA
ncbi:MAG TPA: DUF2330 domain-containing protein [Kofleriaceae bacterium]|nr:DUF2330 domain-containing protein [Kofleriaceae bacterium]